MTESRAVALAVKGRLENLLVQRVLEAATASPRQDRIRNALNAAIEAAEIDPAETRQALLSLRSDQAALERLERCLDDRPAWATLRLGAALQLIVAELASSIPDLRGREGELLRWLEGDW